MIPGGLATGRRQTADRQPIQCDCCGTEVVAVRIGNRLIVQQRRHGKTHVGVIMLTECDLPAHTDDKWNSQAAGPPTQAG